jgi:hypothetical protein
MTEISIRDRPQKQATLTYQPGHQKNPESERHGDPSSAGDDEQLLPFTKGSTYDNMITTCFLDHVCDQFGSDRRPAFVFFVLSGIGEERNDCCNSFGARNFTGMDHDAELHESGVHGATPSVDNVHIILPH